MSALVGYDSSDDSAGERPRARSVVTPEKTNVPAKAQSSEAFDEQQAATFAPAEDVSMNAGPSDGPVAGPTMRTSDADQARGSLSPYSTERAEVMELTLPLAPVFDIPESPPGSPDPALERKFGQFAQLKEQGHHFNERLAKSAASKNPNLFNKLMSSFGIEDEQYATSLPKDIWDPSQFPEWAFKDGLARAQAVAQKQRKDAQRDSGKVDFVPPKKDR